MQALTRASRPALPQLCWQALPRRHFLTAAPFVRARRLPITARAKYQRPFQPIRHNTSLAIPEGEQKKVDSTQLQPSYQLTFTCKPCGHRSAHKISKQGYHHGTVLVTCPSCKNRHVISDHLKIFMDHKSTLEDILKRAAADGDLSKLLKKGKLGMRQGALVGNEGEEDIEFWEDGSESKHEPTGTQTGESEHKK